MNCYVAYNTDQNHQTDDIQGFHSNNKPPNTTNIIWLKQTEKEKLFDTTKSAPSDNS